MENNAGIQAGGLVPATNRGCSSLRCLPTVCLLIVLIIIYLYRRKNYQFFGRYNEVEQLFLVPMLCTICKHDRVRHPDILEQISGSNKRARWGS